MAEEELSIEEIFDRLLEHPDNKLTLECEDKETCETIKRNLSVFKSRNKKKREQVESMMGKFMLRFSMQDTTIAAEGMGIVPSWELKIWLDFTNSTAKTRKIHKVKIK